MSKKHKRSSIDDAYHKSIKFREKWGFIVFCFLMLIIIAIIIWGVATGWGGNNSSDNYCGAPVAISSPEVNGYEEELVYSPPLVESPEVNRYEEEIAYSPPLVESPQLLGTGGCRSCGKKSFNRPLSNVFPGVF